MSDIAEDLHNAVAGVMAAHGYGLVSRLAFVVELVDQEDGSLALLRGSTPWDMPVWSELGLHQYAITDIQAAVTASRVADTEEE